MAAGKHGSSEVTISLDDAQGGAGTPRAIKDFVFEMGGVKVTSDMKDTTAFGDAWREQTPVGMRKGDDIKLGGAWDTTATTGPHAVLISPDYDPTGGTRDFVIVFGDSKTATLTVLLKDYEVVAKVGELTMFNATLAVTGAVTWS